MRFTTANALAQRVAPPPVNATSDGDDKCVVPPVIWQSWYHLFLPRWLAHGEQVELLLRDPPATSRDLPPSHPDLPRPPVSSRDLAHIPRQLLLEFSDDLFGAGAAATMERVRAFLGLAPFAFDTTVAFNTESRRGAVIAKTSNASRNAQAAAAARHSHAEAEGGRLRVVERLVADAVLRTDILLRDPKWSGAPQQHRRAVPAAWLRRYRKYSAKQGSSTRSQ